MYTLAKIASLLCLMILHPVYGQDVEVIYPGHPDFDAGLFEPFEAEYEQMGFPFLVAFRKTQTDPPVFSTLMIMDGPTGIAVDHVGHYAADFSFAYRRFRFGRYRDEYLFVEHRDGEVTMHRMPLGGEDQAEPTHSGHALQHPVFDGTVMYTALAALPLREGYTWRMHMWTVTEDAFEERDTPPFKVEGRETITTEDGTPYDCWVVTIRYEEAGVTFKNYVTKEAPYLIRQVVVQAGEDPMTVVDLKRMRKG